MMLDISRDPESKSVYISQPTFSATWFKSCLYLYLPDLEAQGTFVKCHLRRGH